MARLKSSQGYTLLLTLVIVVLLLLFTATFAIASMNQAKQVKKTDTSIISTSIAEMGAERYVNQLNRDYQSEFDTYRKCRIRAKNQNEISSCFNASLSRIQAVATNYIGDPQNNTKLHPVDGISYYYVSDVELQSNLLNLTVTGVSGTKSSDIIVTFKTDLNFNAVDTGFFELIEQSANSLYTNDIKKCVEQNSCAQLSLYNIQVTTDYYTFTNHPVTSMKYFYLLNGAQINQAFKDGSNFTNQSIFVPSTVSQELLFDKHIVLTSSQLEVPWIKIDHPMSQSYIQDSVVVLSKGFTSSNSRNPNGLQTSLSDNNRLPFVGSSKLCLKSTDTSSLKHVNLIYNDGTQNSSNVNVYYYSSNGTDQPRFRYNNVNVSIPYTGAWMNPVSLATFASNCKLEVPTLEPVTVPNESYLDTIIYN